MGLVWATQRQIFLGRLGWGEHNLGGPSLPQPLSQPHERGPGLPHRGLPHCMAPHPQTHVHQDSLSGPVSCGCLPVSAPSHAPAGPRPVYDPASTKLKVWGDECRGWELFSPLLTSSRPMAFLSCSQSWRPARPCQKHPTLRLCRLPEPSLWGFPHDPSRETSRRIYSPGSAEGSLHQAHSSSSKRIFKGPVISASAGQQNFVGKILELRWVLNQGQWK
ncbi:PREDICTED: uncharacterized protein LOC105581805 [Cercocebus atys]|uniref:uncharacterized protein LOC105581805 n=1 Tax=Cercocebus atys TaxID=9531 RepID=UPI0005F43F12|nr:PREDICTED: uncharacterized protein LOC105581805 [Cercocebus atys]